MARLAPRRGLGRMLPDCRLPFLPSDFRSAGVTIRPVILAGIDEAGYGPILGPLTVGCCALRVPAPNLDQVPCGWKLLRRCASKSRDSTGKRLHINDSKKVYSPASGLSELERAILVLSGAQAGAIPSTLDEALARLVAPTCLDPIAQLPWYRPFTGESFPLETGATSLQMLLNKVNHELARAGVGVVHLRAQVIDEQRLNRYFATTRNKSSTSFTFVATHFDELIRTYADDELVIYCDRQGGREHYGQILHDNFESWSLEVTSERPERSEYRLSKGPRSVRIIFAEKGEGECMAVAIASMLAKYLREALMGRFNAFWKTHMPDVAPTAGYWGDGQRFLRDIEPTCARLGIDPVTLARSR